MTHSVEKDALAVVPLLVNREHEDAPWGCSCGAKFGDGIDRRWHLLNETVKATLAYVTPPAVPDGDGA